MLMNKILRYSFVALLAMVFGNVMATTVDVVIKNYATAQNWANDTKYTSIELDENITASVTGGGNTGKYYTTGDEWRLYQTETPKLTFTAKSGYVLNSITVTYAVKNTGVLLNGTDQVASGTAVSVNGSSHEFSVGNTGTATNGQVKVTAISVTYSADGDTRVDANLSFSPSSLTAKIGKEFTEPTLINANSAPVTYSSSDEAIAKVDASTGKLTLVAAGTTTIKAAVPEDNTSFYGSASYTLTVKKATETAMLPYSEPFIGSGIGKFEIEDVTLGEGLNAVWSYIASYGMKASAYVSSKNYASEAWLISPLIDMTGGEGANLTFDHMINHFTDVETAKNEATVWVREGEAGAWTQLEGITYPTALGNNFVNAGAISLSAYKDKTIQIGFKYTSTATKAGTWEIKNFSIAAGQPAGLAWSKNSWTVTMGESEITYPTLTNPNSLAVTYSSSEKGVATISDAGVITLVGAGETTIKAAFAGDGTYSAGEATYKLTVVDGNAKGGKFNPYTIAEVKALEESAYPTGKVWVKGYIAGCAADGGVISTKDAVNSNILLTATGEFDATDVLVPVALPSGSIRTALNLVDHADYVGKEVKVYGTIESYFKVTGVKSVSDCELTGNSVEIKIKQYTITITPAEHGSMTLDKYEAVAGEKVYVTDMKVNDGWEMDEPTITAENGAKVEVGGSDEEGHYLVMPASNVTITLSITQLYTITPVFDSNKGDVRGISFDSEKSPIYKGAGKNVKFTVTAKEGFEVESVTAADADNTPITVNVAADKSYYEFEMPAKDVTITATFKEVQAEEQGQSWDFTKWSAETVANLIADAAASKTSGWSDVEKAADAEAGADPTEASKNNCFWCVAEPNEDGTLSANGEVIEELKGLKWNKAYTVKRSLAIAVNYPTALSDYAGPAYLWLGGGKNKIPCFTIPGVKAGSKITMEVESHNTTKSRGVELYTGVDAGGLVDAATKIGDTFTPTTKDSHTWTVENDCDVIVYNTDGCHLYSIKVEAGSTGISTVKAQKTQNNVIYNLAGQKVDNSYKGVVIVNGKKMLQK